MFLMGENFHVDKGCAKRCKDFLLGKKTNHQRTNSYLREQDFFLGVHFTPTSKVFCSPKKEIR